MPRGVCADPVREAEHRAKISTANRRRYEDPIEREKTAAANRHRFEDPDQRAKISGDRSANWKGVTQVYGSRHRQVYRERGKASAQACVDCGSAAKQWSQRHGTGGFDPADYEPRCVRCHIRYDKEFRLSH